MFNISVGSGGSTIEESGCSVTPSPKQDVKMILYGHTPNQNYHILILANFITSI